MYSIQGNICGARIKAGRNLQKPPISQEGLAERLRAQGLEYMSKSVVSRIENNRRHVWDTELRAIAHALEVPMDWLVGC